MKSPGEIYFRVTITGSCDDHVFEWVSRPGVRGRMEFVKGIAGKPANELMKKWEFRTLDADLYCITVKNFLR
jgi:hypothetical protein